MILDKPIEVYNIEVKDLHSYHIGAGKHENLLVHNKCVDSFVKLNPLGLDLSTFSHLSSDAPPDMSILKPDPAYSLPSLFGLAYEEYGDSITISVTSNMTPSQTMQTTTDHGFSGETTVILVDGSTKNIEELLDGDVVLAVPDDVVNSEAVGCTVTDIYRTYAEKTIMLRFAAESGELLEIEAGEEQLFCLLDGTWVTAADLNVNQMCVSASGVGMLLIDKTLNEEVQTLYVLTVADNHTFFVGNSLDDMVLVHNSVKPVAWVLKKVGMKFVKSKPLYSNKEAAMQIVKNIGKKNGDEMTSVLVRNGSSQAKAVANTVRTIAGNKTAEAAANKAAKATGDILKHRGHQLKDAAKNVIGKGDPHYQLDKIGGHIFYSSLATLILAAASDAKADEDGYSVHIDTYYNDPYPGECFTNAATVTYWMGEDSVASYADFINPMSLVATAGDIGRSIDREIWKTAMLHVVVIEKDGKIEGTIYIDADGNLIPKD